MKTFDFWFDFGSPAAYLASTQIAKMEKASGAKANWRPMLLGGVFQATGNSSPATVPAKGRYSFGDFSRFAKRYGVPLSVNPFFPINTLMLMRGAAGMQRTDPDRFPEYCRAMFSAIWIEALNLNDPAILGGAIARAGFDPAGMMALCNDQTTKDDLKAATQLAVERGVFGAPTFFVGEEMFWGQDRIDFVLEALA